MNGGVLYLPNGLNNVGGTILNSGGTINMEAVTGGTLASTASSPITAALGTFIGVTVLNNSLITVPNSHTLYIESGITNNGTIFVSGSTSYSTCGSLYFKGAGTQTLSGNGTVVLGGSPPPMTSRNFTPTGR